MQDARGNWQSAVTRASMATPSQSSRASRPLLNIMMLLTVVALTATLAAPASAAPVVHNLGIVNGRAT